MIRTGLGKRALLASVLLLGLGFAALPARAHSDVSFGLSIGSPYYYAAPRAHYYYEPAPYYSTSYAYRPSRHYYHGRWCPPGRHVHNHHYRYDRDYWRDRDWDDDWDD